MILDKKKWKDGKLLKKEEKAAVGCRIVTFKFNKNPEKFLCSSHFSVLSKRAFKKVHLQVFQYIFNNFFVWELRKENCLILGEEDILNYLRETRNLRNLPITSALTSAFVFGSQWGLCGWQVFVVFLLSLAKSLSTRCCHVIRSFMYSSSALSRKMINLPPSPRCLRARMIIIP